MRPSVPDRCIQGVENETGACHLVVHHWRNRKTGPEFPLLVLQCRTHGVAFTLYPLAHVPYGRVAVAPVDTDGRLLPAEGDSSTEPPSIWEETIFGAAQDAAEGVAWPRKEDNCPEAGGSPRTQRRRIELAADVLGLRGQDNSPLIGPLGISALGHQEAKRAYQGATAYRTLGSAVCQAVGELALAPCPLLDMVLAAGFAAGRWGKPWRWDTSRGQLREVMARARSP